MVAFCSTLLNAQGVRIWNHGKYMEYKEECVDSLVFFEKEEPAGEGQGNVLNDHEWMDLGLPSGTLWATMNLGASSPEKYGDYYAWGEVATKSYFTFASYTLSKDPDGYTRYVPKAKAGVFGYDGFYDTLTSLAEDDDAARAVWGEGWEMPTYEQMQELLTCCTWVWTQLNGINGYRVYGPNGQSIFLPASGSRSVSHKVGVGKCTFLWLRDLYTPNPSMGCCLYLNERMYYLSTSLRYLGQVVRPVLSPAKSE